MKIETQMKIIEAVHAAIDTANRALSREYFYPKCDFSLRGTAAGIAYSRINMVNFNPGIAEENLEHFLKQTVPHEVAHLVANYYYCMNCGHNHKWKYIMRMVYGLEPKRCHNYDVKNHVVRKTYIYKYKCGCQNGVAVGPKHHKVLQSRPLAVRCKTCGFRLSRENFLEKRLKY